MFNKTKVLLCSLAVLGGLGLVACNQQPDERDSFEQNTNKFEANEEMYIIGSHWHGWDNIKTIKEANPSCRFTRVTSNEYTFDAVVTADMVANGANAEFKFIASNSWNVQYGMEDVDFDECNAAFKALFPDKTKESWNQGSSNRSNVTVNKAGTYHISYDPYNFKTDDAGRSFKFVIDFTAATAAQ